MSAGKMAPHEKVVFMPKMIVAYFDSQQQSIKWQFLPIQQFETLDNELSFISYHRWEFDPYFHFLGNKVRERISTRLGRMINNLCRLSKDLYLRSKSNQLKSCMKTIRKYELRMLKKYYRGCYLTKVFRKKFQTFIEQICFGIVSFLRYETRPQNLLSPSTIS